MGRPDSLDQTRLIFFCIGTIQNVLTYSKTTHYVSLQRTLALERNMTITIYAFTDDRTRLLEKKATFWNDTISPEAVADIWESEGFIVTREVDG